MQMRVDSIGRALELPAEVPALAEIRRIVTVFRELREGKTEDGKAKLKSPSGTLSPAEAISVVTNGMALAATSATASLKAARRGLGPDRRDRQGPGAGRAWSGASTSRPWSRNATAGRISTAPAATSSRRMAELHFFGIRHHGPGSARSLVRALEAVRPDVVLIEGPPDANDLLPLASHAGLEPPVALLIYLPERPRARGVVPVRAVFAGVAGHSVRPCAEGAAAVHRPAAVAAFRRGGSRKEGEEADDEVPATICARRSARAHGARRRLQRRRALVGPARESREGHDLDVFKAVHEMMARVARGTRRAHAARGAAARGAHAQVHSRRQRRGLRTDRRRMRRVAYAGARRHAGREIRRRAAQGPARRPRPPRPGCRGRTSASRYRSGYGAGIESPVWYELLWEQRDGARRAMADARRAPAARRGRADLVGARHRGLPPGRCARLGARTRRARARRVPRRRDLGARQRQRAQPAHHRARAGTSASGSARCPRNFRPRRSQQDLAALQKRLRLPPKAEEKTLDLDLREEFDRDRSHLLRRLRLLGMEWGEPAARSRRPGHVPRGLAARLEARVRRSR